MTNRYNHTITPEDMDSKGLATFPALYRMIINSIGQNIRKEGYGIDVMARKGLTWALARCGFEFYSRPGLYSEIEVGITPGGACGLCYDRYISISGPDGTVLGRGITEWCMLDKTTRRPVTDLIQEAKPEMKWPCKEPRRIKAFEIGDGLEKTAGYSECDFNGHLNNSKYVETFFNLLPRKIAEAVSPMRLDVNFKREIPCDARTVSGILSREDGSYDFCMYCDSQVACCASFSRQDDEQ